jgi:hypothetical protein
MSVEYHLQPCRVAVGYASLSCRSFCFMKRVLLVEVETILYGRWFRFALCLHKM